MFPSLTENYNCFWFDEKYKKAICSRIFFKAILFDGINIITWFNQSILLSKTDLMGCLEQLKWSHIHITWKYPAFQYLQHCWRCSAYRRLKNIRSWWMHSIYFNLKTGEFLNLQFFETLTPGFRLSWKSGYQKLPSLQFPDQYGNKSVRKTFL